MVIVMAEKPEEGEAKMELEEAEEAEEIPEAQAEEAAAEEAAEEAAEGGEIAKPRKKREKKAVKKRKSRKEKENPLVCAVRLAVETGKVEFGAKNGMKDSLLGKARLIVVSSNAPHVLLEDINYYSKLSGIPVLVFDGTSMELGSICGKPYPVSVLSVYEEGSSGILALVKK